MSREKKRTIRRTVQAFFFILIGLIAINETLSKAGGGIPFLSDASLHALCPFGGVVTLYSLATVGTLIHKIHVSSLVIMGLIFLLALLFGPVFCGWICPLGSLQEWTGKIGQRIFKRRYNRFIPKKPDRILRYFRYVLLFWVLYVTARSGQLLFANIDPYHALFQFWSGEVAPTALLVLALTLLGSLFIERPWCKYACPYGALLGLFNKFRIFKIRRNAATCISCHKCDKACPMNIDICNANKITSLQCISCYECTSEVQCPVSNSLNLQTSGRIGKPFTVKMLAMALIIFTVIFGGIYTSKALGIWSTIQDRNPNIFRDDGHTGQGRGLGQQRNIDLHEEHQ